MRVLFRAVGLSIPVFISSSSGAQPHSLWLVSGKPLKLGIDVFSAEIRPIQCYPPRQAQKYQEPSPEQSRNAEGAASPARA